MPSTWRPVVCFCQAPLSQTYHIRLSSTAAYRLQYKLDITIGKNESGTEVCKNYTIRVSFILVHPDVVVRDNILGKPQETQLMNRRVAAESRTFPAGHGTELWSPCIVGNYPIY